VVVVVATNSICLPFFRVLNFQIFGTVEVVRGSRQVRRGAAVDGVRAVGVGDDHCARQCEPLTSSAESSWQRRWLPSTMPSPTAAQSLASGKEVVAVVSLWIGQVNLKMWLSFGARR